MNPISQFWRWFTTPHIIAEWKWEGNDLSDLPRAAWRDFCRAIRGSIFKVLIGDDLVIVGDIYCSRVNQSSPLIQVPCDRYAEIIGNITVYEGSTAIVPKGCVPKVWDQPANLNVQTNMTLTPEQISLFNSLVERLQAKASRPHAIDYRGDDFCAIDAGSYDDAFDWGCQVGEIDYARELCDFLKVPYTVDKEW